MVRLPSLSILAALAVVVPLASCSSGNGNAAPSDLSPAVKAQWDAYCAARVACLSGSTCATSTCMAAGVEEGPLVEFLDCQNAKACGANDDECYATAGTTDAEREAFTARCTAAIAAVGSSQSPPCYVDPVLCTIVAYPIIRKQYMQAVDACLTSSTCTALQTCIGAAIAPLDCN